MQEINKEYFRHLCSIATIFPYGSAVYGTYKEGISDYDYIFVISDDSYKCLITDLAYENMQYEENQFIYKNIQITVYSHSMWEKIIEDNDVKAVECSFLPAGYVKLDEEFTKIIYPTIDITIDKNKIRKNFSAVASNSWVKCKKKLTVKEDFAPRIGKKSLWHALRLLDFGTQIMCFDKIVNYSSMNFIYNDIVENEYNDWEIYKNKFQKFYNALKTNFRLSEDKNYEYKSPEEVWNSLYNIM